MSCPPKVAAESWPPARQAVRMDAPNCNLLHISIAIQTVRKYVEREGRNGVGPDVFNFQNGTSLAKITQYSMSSSATSGGAARRQYKKKRQYICSSVLLPQLLRWACNAKTEK